MTTAAVPRVRDFLAALFDGAAGLIELRALGRLEWHAGRELAVYSARPRLFARLWALSGVRRWQVGDQEVRGLFPVEALAAVARLIRARRRRRGNAGSFQTTRHSAASAA